MHLCYQIGSATEDCFNAEVEDGVVLAAKAALLPERGNGLLVRLDREGTRRLGMEVNDGRSAVISQNQLGKMQGNRLNPNPKLKIFLSEADALAWINDPAHG